MLAVLSPRGMQSCGSERGERVGLPAATGASRDLVVSREALSDGAGLRQSWAVKSVGQNRQSRWLGTKIPAMWLR